MHGFHKEERVRLSIGVFFLYDVPYYSLNGHNNFFETPYSNMKARKKKPI